MGYKTPEHFENILSFIENRKPAEKFREYLKRKAIEPVAKTDYQLKNDPLFLASPLMLSRSQSKNEKPVFVLFEAENCLEWCFHKDVLSLADIREKLKSFDIARLDAKDNKTVITTPFGKQMTQVNGMQVQK